MIKKRQLAFLFYMQLPSPGRRALCYLKWLGDDWRLHRICGKWRWLGSSRHYYPSKIGPYSDI